MKGKLDQDTVLGIFFDTHSYDEIAKKYKVKKPLISQIKNKCRYLIWTRELENGHGIITSPASTLRDSNGICVDCRARFQPEFRAQYYCYACRSKPVKPIRRD